MAQVRDYMDSDSVSVRPDASVEEVARVLGENELHGVPVTEEDGTVVGLVFLEPFRRFEKRMKKAVAATAAQMMTADPRTVGPGDDVHDAAHVIVETGHNRIPVVEDGRLAGVISRADVVRALAAGQ